MLMMEIADDVVALVVVAIWEAKEVDELSIGDVIYPVALAVVDMNIDDDGDE